MKISDMFLAVCIFLYTKLTMFAHKTGFQHTHGGGGGRNGTGNNGNGNGQVPEIDGNELFMTISIIVVFYLIYAYDNKEVK